MKIEARYKVRQEILGPRPLEDIKNEIISGALPVETPIQLLTDGLWTDLKGAEVKVRSYRNPVLPRSLTFRFLATNLVLVLVGYFWPAVCLLGALALYVTGAVANYFEEGRRRPSMAFIALLSMLFPFFVLIFSGERAKPHVLWLVFSGFFQLAVFIVFIRLRYA